MTIMRKFLIGADEAYAELEKRARTAQFIQFTNVELPAGCVPGKARIGFKVDPGTGVATLFIDHGIRYYGANQDVRRWVSDGKLTFSNFDALRQWIRSDLKNVFEERNEGSVSSEPPVPSQSPAESASAELAPAAASPPPSTTPLDPTAKAVLQFAVRQIGRNYDIDVRAIDDRLLVELNEEIRANAGRAPAGTIIDDILGGPFALAAVQGHLSANLIAGPPITCQACPPPE